MTLQELKTQLRAGPYAWPGGYPLFLITEDGAALSFAAVRERFRDVCEAYLRDGAGADCAQWRIAAAEVNWEDAALYCDHSGARIPSAYAEDDAADAA